MGLPANQQKFVQSINELQNMLCPCAITLHLSRIDTKANHPHKSVYDADRTYFRTTQHRAFIREAHCGEFDYSPSSAISTETYPSLEFQSIPLPNEALRSVWSLIPKLWVLVTDYGEGVHHVSSIYRGDAMWPVQDREGIDTAIFKSTEDLSKALAKAQQREGIDKQAWKRFVAKYWDACVMDAAVIDSEGMAVN